MDTDAATMPATPPRFEDDTDNSSISDYDSEWTQVSQSEDESDFPFGTLTDGSVSHRDTDSVNGDPWEGLNDELPDTHDDVYDRLHRTDLVINAAAPDAVEARVPADPPAAIEADHEIIAALDNSMTGTLEAVRTRSLSASPEQSMTESQSRLRLSFPDPLQRSKEDITRSYEEVKSSRKSISHSSDESTTSSRAASVDMGSLPTPSVSEVPAEDIKRPSVANFSFTLSIVLYGSNSSSKWSIAEKVIKLAFVIKDESLSYQDRKETRVYRFNVIPTSSTDSLLDAWQYVQVSDRTCEYTVPPQKPSSEPSLALVFLPTQLPLGLPKHDFYMPLLSQEALDLPAFSMTLVRDAAQESWRQLAIPREKVMLLRPNASNAILDETQLAYLDRGMVSVAFTKLFGVSHRRSAFSRCAAVGLAHRYASGLILLTTLVAGLSAVIMNPHVGTPTSSSAPTHSFASHLEWLQTMAANSSPAITTATMTSSVAVIPSSLKDYALAVFQPSAAATTEAGSKRPSRTCASGTIRATDRPTMRQRFDIATVPDCNCEPKASRSLSWSERLVTTREIMVQLASADHVLNAPLATVQIPPTISPTQAHPPVPTEEVVEEQSLSTRLLDSLSVVMDTKAVDEVVSNEMRILHVALKQLLIALGRQADIIRRDWHAAKSRLRDSLSRRHAHARENARRLRDTSGRFLTSAGARLRKNVAEARVMMDHARQKARLLRREAAKSEARLADAQKATVDDFEWKRKERMACKESRRRARRAIKKVGRARVKKGRFDAETVIQNVMGLVF